MNKRKKLWGVTISLFLQALSMSAQQMLTLDDLFRMADNQSQQIRISKTSVLGAEEAVKSAKSQRLPDVETELSIGYLGDGALSDRDFTNWTHVDNPHFTNNFALKVQQIVWSGGAITVGIRMAELGKEMAELDLRHNREEVRFIIAGQYLDLCRLKNHQTVVEENITLTDTLIQNTQARIEAGTALQNDVTRYELQRENLLLQSQKLTDAMSIICHQLSTTLHTQIHQEQINAMEIPADFGSVDWQQLAANENIGIHQAATAIRMSEQKLELKHSELLPKVAIVAENHFDGPITIEVPVIDKNFNYWFAGIGIQYSLSSLWKSNKAVGKARYDLQQAQERHTLAMEGVNKAVQAAYTNFLTAQTELRTQQKSVELATEHYRITSNRYTNGLCLMTDMLDASNTKLSAELALVNARINILYHYYQLKYISSTL